MFLLALTIVCLLTRPLGAPQRHQIHKTQENAMCFAFPVDPFKACRYVLCINAHEETGVQYTSFDIANSDDHGGLAVRGELRVPPCRGASSEVRTP